jgi:beta-lactam-binding protein with PASTA domain
VVIGNVPDVVGMTLANAENAITSAGLTVGYVFNLISSTVPVGCIIGQDPAAGASVAPGTAMLLSVSTGPQTVIIPNVVGMTQANAGSALASAGLVTGTITQTNSSTVASGNVISQSPAAGVSSTAGTPVNLTVSLGPAPVVINTVPDVVGMTQANAENAITSAGLTVGYVFYLSSSTVPVGCVIGQYPAAGAPVDQGAAILISVSVGP